MSLTTKQVVVCDGWVQAGEPCDRVFNHDDIYITVTLRARRSDLPRDEYVGMERFTAEKKARLRRELHLHPSCMLGQDVLNDFIRHATTVTEWPELTEDD